MYLKSINISKANDEKEGRKDRKERGKVERDDGKIMCMGEACE